MLGDIENINFLGRRLRGNYKRILWHVPSTRRQYVEMNGEWLPIDISLMQDSDFDIRQTTHMLVA